MGKGNTGDEGKEGENGPEEESRGRKGGERLRGFSSPLLPLPPLSSSSLPSSSSTPSSSTSFCLNADHVLRPVPLTEATLLPTLYIKSELSCSSALKKTSMAGCNQQRRIIPSS